MNQATHPKLFAPQHPIQLTPVEQVKVLQYIADLAGQVDGLADKATRKTTTLVYLSGPMSGLPELNHPAFHAAAHALRQIGYTVFNPAEIKLDTTGMNEEEIWRAYMRVCIKELVGFEALVMLPGWPESRGAIRERNIAQDLGMPIMTLTDAILEAPTHVEAAYKAVSEMAVAA